MALISVIVPVYRVEAYLPRCLDSILAQTFTDFEVILVDDGSPDNCGAICDEYARKDPRIHVIHQQNQGIAATRNVGLKWVFSRNSSKYVSFVDSDDWVHKRYLELLLKGLIDFSADMSQCGFIRVSQQIGDPQVGEKCICVSPDEQYVHWYSPFSWGKLFRVDRIMGLHFPDGEIFEDVLVFYKLFFSYEKIAILDESLYSYFQRSDGIMRSEWTPAKYAQIRAWDEQLDFAAEHGSAPVLRSALQHFVFVYKHQYRDIERSSLVTAEQKKKYLSGLKRNMRLVLRRFRKELLRTGTFWEALVWALPYGDRLVMWFGRLYRRMIGEEKPNG